MFHVHGCIDGQRHSLRSRGISRHRCGGRPTLDHTRVRLCSAEFGGSAVTDAGASDALVERAETEAVDDRVAEATIHGAVDDEVDSAVDQHKNVPDITQRSVDGVEQLFVEATE